MLYVALVTKVGINFVMGIHQQYLSSVIVAIKVTLDQVWKRIPIRTLKPMEKVSSREIRLNGSDVRRLRMSGNSARERE